MSTTHTGNIQPQLDYEEHDGLATGKKAVIRGNDINGGGYKSASTAAGQNANVALVVALMDAVTGAALSVQKNPGTLASGALSSSFVEVYTVTSGKKAWVTLIRVVNTSGASTRTVTIEFKAAAGGTARCAYTIDIGPGEYAEAAFDGGEGMSSGNVIAMKQNSGTDVDYKISGEEI